MSRLKPNELRVGNIVAIPKGKGSLHEPLTAWQIHQFTLHKQGNESVPAYYGAMYPETIKKHWLIQLGFREDIVDLMEYELYRETKDDGEIKVVSVVYGLRDDDCYIETAYYLPSENYSSAYEADLPHIKYVHQIQNLIFDLTGKELELIPQEESFL